MRTDKEILVIRERARVLLRGWAGDIGRFWRNVYGEGECWLDEGERVRLRELENDEAYPVREALASNELAEEGISKGVSFGKAKKGKRVKEGVSEEAVESVTGSKSEG